MADAYTKIDALGFYLSGKEADVSNYLPAASLGGLRLSVEEIERAFLADPTRQIRSLAIAKVLGDNVVGTGELSAGVGLGADKAAWTAPGGAIGTAVTVSNGCAALLEDANDTDRAIRVYRDAEDGFAGYIPTVLYTPFNNALAMSDIASTGGDRYRALWLVNHSDQALTNVHAYLAPLGTQRTTDGGQLPASGAGSFITTASMVDAPERGFARIEDSGGTLREIVYYYRTTSPNQAWVDAAGRGLLGTSASAGAATDVVDFISGLRLAKEAGNATTGKIQEIADASTAPSGRSWKTGMNTTDGVQVGTLAQGAQYGLWLHRHTINGATADAAAKARIILYYTYDGNNYARTVNGLYRVTDSTCSLYALYAGVDTDPNFDAAPSASNSTLPFSYALAAPGSGETEYRITIRRQTEYGLRSVNTYTRSIVIDAAGEDVTPEIADPVDVTAEDAGSGCVRITARYWGSEASPADTWDIYVSTDGTDPDPSADSPTSETMVAAFASSGYSLDYEAGPYTWGTDCRVLVRARRSSDDVDSANTTPETLTIGSATLPHVGRGAVFQGSAHPVPIERAIADVTYLDSPTNSVYWAQYEGETYLYANSIVVWRALFDDDGEARFYFPADWALVSDTVSGAGSSDVVEVVSGTEIYICVDSVRRLKIDATAKTLTATTWVAPDTLEANPTPGTDWQRSDAVGLQAFSRILGQWRPYMVIESDGTVSVAGALKQRST